MVALIIFLGFCIKAHVGGAGEIFKLNIPGTEQTLIGVSRANVKDQSANGKHIMKDTVDRKFKYKTTAYLLYNILVDGKKSVSLHMRFRMAVWHPGLSMLTFGKLMSSPGAIEDLLKKIVAGKLQSGGFM